MNRILLTIGILMSVFIVVIGLVLLFIAKTSPVRNPSIPSAPTSIPQVSVTPTPSAIGTTKEKFSDQDFSDKPWLLKLPLKDPLYYVAYDFTTNTIKASLYPTQLFYVSTEDQVNGLKQTIEQRLRSIGVDIAKEKIEWVVEK